MPNPHQIEPHNHVPRQHRDGKPPWCDECGLTAMYEEPKAGNRFPAAPATPMQDSVTKNIMSEFSYSQLPHNQAVIARPFCELAWKMHEELPKGPSKTECLRSLRNAMQSAIRAEVNGQPATSET